MVNKPTNIKHMNESQIKQINSVKKKKIRSGFEPGPLHERRRRLLQAKCKGTWKIIHRGEAQLRTTCKRTQSKTQRRS